MVEYDNIEEILKVGNTLFQFNSYSISTGNNYYVFTYLDLKRITKVKYDRKKNWDYDADRFAVASFTTTVDSRVQMMKMQDSVDGGLVDYQLGFLKNYLQQINKGLEERRSDDFYEEKVSETDLAKLKDDKLYVPQQILYNYNAFTKEETEKSPDEIFEDYPYEYAVVSNVELNDLILNSDKPFYYLMHHQKNAHKIITITEGLSGKIIYRDHTNISFNIKSKDMKRLAKEME